MAWFFWTWTKIMPERHRKGLSNRLILSLRMLRGKRFILKSPTVAVDAQRVVFILPAGAVLTVTSDTSTVKRMIEVTWENRKLAMFGSDLTERAEENVQTEPLNPSEFVDPREIRQFLQDDFDAAQQRRIAASKRFTEVMNDIPSGIPHPDGTDRIRLASRDYSESREAATAAMKRLSDFLIRGIIPPELERKPVHGETRDKPDKKCDEG